MQDCLFCKISKGEIPSHKIYEDDVFVAFLDINPQEQGHTLIVPKTHNETIYDLPADTAAQLMPLAKKLADAINKSLQPKGLNVKQNNGKAAGQEVMHYHLHLIPRFADKPVESRDLETVAELISRQIDS